jgi:hypothetical protein
VYNAEGVLCEVCAEAEETVEHQAYNTACVEVNMKCIMQRVFCVRYELSLRNSCTSSVNGRNC